MPLDRFIAFVWKPNW